MYTTLCFILLSVDIIRDLQLAAVDCVKVVSKG
jgi:hypothetical protein